jgi:hypothetical protein
MHNVIAFRPVLDRRRFGAGWDRFVEPVAQTGQCQAAVAPLGLNESEDIIMVMAFSVGLAFTLVVTGVVAAWSLRHAEKRFSGLGGVARKLPYLSSGILALLAIYIGIQGWWHLPSHS